MADPPPHRDLPRDPSGVWIASRGAWTGPQMNHTTNAGRRATEAIVSSSASRERRSVDKVRSVTGACVTKVAIPTELMTKQMRGCRP